MVLANGELPRPALAPGARLHGHRSPMTGRRTGQLPGVSCRETGCCDDECALARYGHRAGAGSELCFAIAR